MAPFNDLPDMVFQLLFDRFSSQEILHLGHVCKYWQRQQTLTTANRHHLVLLQGSQPLTSLRNSHFESAFTQHDMDLNGAWIDWNEFQKDTLTLTVFNEWTVEFISENFKRLDSLTVVQNDICSKVNLPMLIDLLLECASTLTSVKLYLNYGHLNDFENLETRRLAAENIHQLIRTFNSMPALKKLTLELENELPLEVTPQDLRFLSKLDQFYCLLPGMSQSWFTSIKQLANQSNSNGQRLQQLEQLGFETIDSLDSRVYLEDDWPLPKSMTHLPCERMFYHDAKSKLTEFCGKFTSLRTLALDEITFDSVCELAGCLSPLRNLIHLRFSVMTPMSEPEKDLDLAYIMPLPSVLALDLVIGTNTHQEFLRLSIPLSVMLPNLRSLRFIDHRRVCHPRADHEVIRNPPKEPLQDVESDLEENYDDNFMIDGVEVEEHVFPKVALLQCAEEFFTSLKQQSPALSSLRTIYVHDPFSWYTYKEPSSPTYSVNSSNSLPFTPPTNGNTSSSNH